jgi:hypothetical protein
MGSGSIKPDRLRDHSSVLSEWCERPFRLRRGGSRLPSEVSERVLVGTALAWGTSFSPTVTFDHGRAQEGRCGSVHASSAHRNGGTGTGVARQSELSTSGKPLRFFWSKWSAIQLTGSANIGCSSLMKAKISSQSWMVSSGSA